MNRDEHKLRDAFQRNLDDLRPSTPIESIRRGARRGRIVTALATASLVAVAGIALATVSMREGSIERFSPAAVTQSGPIPPAPMDALNHLPSQAFWTGERMVAVSGGHASESPGAMEIGVFDPSQEKWVDVAQPGLQSRDGYSAVWTGEYLVIWGGANDSGALADGARYDPRTDQWTDLPPSPLAPRSGQVAAWTGKEVVIQGGSSCCEHESALFADGAAYDPVTDTWRQLPLPPDGQRSEAIAVWTGTQMIVWGGVGDHGLLSDGLAYSPDPNKWDSIDAAPIAGRVGMAAVWTGDEVVVWGGSALSHGLSLFDDGAAFNPISEQWRHVGTSPLSARRDMASVVVSDEVVLWGGSLTDTFEGTGEPASDGAIYHPAEDAWTTLEDVDISPRVGPAAVWTGSEIIIWGGCCADRNENAGYLDGGWIRLP